LLKAQFWSSIAAINCDYLCVVICLNPYITMTVEEEIATVLSRLGGCLLDGSSQQDEDLVDINVDCFQLLLMLLLDF